MKAWLVLRQGRGLGAWGQIRPTSGFVCKSLALKDMELRVISACDACHGATKIELDDKAYPSLLAGASLDRHKSRIRGRRLGRVWNGSWLRKQRSGDERHEAAHKGRP